MIPDIETETERRLKYLVHDQDSISQSTIAEIENIHENPSLKFYCIFDKIVEGLRPADIFYILARPSMAKTTLVAYLAQQQAMAIHQGYFRHLENPQVVYVTFEQTVEDAKIIMMGNKEFSSSDIFHGKANLDEVKTKAVADESLPFTFIGNSRRNFGIKQPELHIEALVDILWALKKGSVTPVVIYLDYLQYPELSDDSWKDEKMSKVMKIIKELDKLKKEIGVPIIVTAQAGRGVDKYDLPIPEADDGQWSSAIEQYADWLMSIMRPARVPKMRGEVTIEIEDKLYSYSPWFFIAQMLKARHSLGYGLYPMHFHPHRMFLSPDFIKPRSEEMLVDLNNMNGTPPQRKEIVQPTLEF